MPPASPDRAVQVGNDRPEVERLHLAVHDRLRAAGQIYTKGRRRLVGLLAGLERPMTMPELLDGHADLPPSSTYRNLAVLEELGIVCRIATGGEHARFELAEDLTEHHHHHLICTTCGRVDDFTISSAAERVLDRALATVVEASGFAPDGHRMDLVGTCVTCQAQRRASVG